MDDIEKKQSGLNLPGFVKIGAALLGPGSLGYFFLFLIFNTRVTINLDLSFGAALLTDTGLSLLFFFQHSVMVRKSFKQRLITWIPEHWVASVYAMTSGMTLIFVVIFWQAAGPPFFEIPGWGSIVMGICIFFSLIGFQWGRMSLPGFDPFGIQPSGKRLKPTLRFRGPYKYMRHPLYFFTLVLIWSTTIFTADRLLFNLLWTGWIFLGTWFEEKDLVAFFGEEYRHYQQHTPMIIPLKRSKPDS